MNLIIVESPTKARTFNRILKGKDYFVFATMGHIRDLPTKSISIDYKKKYKPKYEIIKIKKKVVDQLKKLAKKNDQIILATDLDREGESISYHVAYLLDLIKEKWPDFNISNPDKLKRIVFHEITESALKEALENPQNLRSDLVKAQQARRILDRIVGYELSPLLWKKIGKNWLSAGRVQTVVLRLIVEREKEIRRFVTETYFQIYGHFGGKQPFKAKLVKKNGQSFEISNKISLFDGDYTYTKTSIVRNNVETIKADLPDDYLVTDLQENTISRFPPPPHTTSLLQQDAFIKHGFSSKLTMKLAQDLYERGLITYHRTDSFNLSTQFVFRAKDYIVKNFGEAYALVKPRGYRTKSKMAQEAHEAIRPTNVNKDVATVFDNEKLTMNHKRLYQLIFNRALATQMKEAQIKNIKLVISGKKQYFFESDFQQVLFDGFLKVLNPDFVKNNIQTVDIKKGESIILKDTESVELNTKPPVRYNEASLIKSLEEKGIGRPSTYAPIISLIQDKHYIEKQMRYFVPTKLGEAICDYLSQSFSQVFDLGFTARMEEGLDLVAQGNKELVQLLDEFYQPFKSALEQKKDDKIVIDVEEEVDEKCIKCGSKMVVRYSKFGKFLACSNYPKCKNTKPFLQFVEGKKCEKCGGRLVIRFTRKRKRFYGCENYPKCDYSLWKLKSV
ncbi:type I DNA topoisomerase [Candidatus Roizmanbacteria bacterium]|jgi:DNA topoisomerase-1|nr:type I DNA topoisomerase [Candidatus Roizmanbacteria bacterium]